ELVAKLQKGRPLRVKWGADPSAPDLHLGHTVILNKLRQFQDLGHKVVFIIGDFTAMIGDPTGKSETRKPLTAAETARNAKTYQDQVFMILDKSRTEVVYNSHWLAKLTITDTINLAGKYTVARMLERDDFMNRFEKERPISIHEFLYPLIQGYDSVEVKADIEVGGSDQKFNMLVGRELQREFKEEPQVILTLPILEGTDGVNKMSKSLGNYIGITEPPAEIYGKIMSISDELMLRYYELLTEIAPAEVKALHPKAAKMQLARILVARFHSEPAAAEAEKEFEAVFKSGGVPQEIELKKLPMPEMNIIDLLAVTKLAVSRSEARRLVQQDGVSVDGVVVKDEDLLVDLKNERLLKV
ncbi:MAG TPA: tyrosine--tRNA ligase, partial [Candidatus Sulfotelmatobacter sp.]|nr:tyrosine--tRNA ligase [Candidatus Sulfotelmatobacter sp.]